MLIFDTHAHYDDRQFDEDREHLLSNLERDGIGRVVNVGADLESSKSCVALAAQYDTVYAAVGVHPSDVDCLNDESFEWLVSHCHDNKVVAIGEIGLDYYWEKDSAQQKMQQYWFIRQLELARQEKLPVIIHSRDAAEDTFRVMKEQNAQQIGGVVHCYSYSVELAREYVKMGFYIGIGGVVTFKNAKKLKEVAADIPLERIVLETDCPYLAPEPHRGKRNASVYLHEVAEEIAKIRGISKEEVVAAAWDNACRLYRLADQ
jgi:TatD DNase family protein